MRKALFMFTAVVAVCFLAAPAMAFILESNSNEMVPGEGAEEYCDQAGNFKINFGAEDINDIVDYLADPDNNYAQLRVTLGGVGLDKDAAAPVLCRDIMGDGTYTDENTLDNSEFGNLVALDLIGTELSNHTTEEGSTDITAFVYGETGESTFYIFITEVHPDIADAAANDTGIVDWSDANDYPWIRVGLHGEVMSDEVADHDGVSTAICADVKDFYQSNWLIVNIDTTPVMTYTTSDNQIGHFVPEEAISLRKCAKLSETVTEYCVVEPTSEIELCEESTTVVGQTEIGSCVDYYYCAILDGEWPEDEQVTLTLRTYGNEAGTEVQTGVYIRDITLQDEDGAAVMPTSIVYYSSIGLPVTPGVNGDGTCNFAAQMAEVTVDSGDITQSGSELKICMTYNVKVSEAVVDSDAMLWYNIDALPCGTLGGGSDAMARMVECEGSPSCLYFPYVFTGLGDWQVGIAISNMTEIAAENMIVTYTLYMADGTMSTYTKSDFTGKTDAFMLDSMIEQFDPVPAAGLGWMHVKAENFTGIDGLMFQTNAQFGGETLPRLISCD